VPIPPSGIVADGVRFYFAARSPILYVIYRGSVPTHAGGQDDMVYLVTNVEHLREAGSSPCLLTARQSVSDSDAEPIRVLPGAPQEARDVLATAE